MSSWKGTNYNERIYNGARNGLVSIYLDGVRGISPVVLDEERRMVSPADADRYIRNARRVYVELVEQKAPRSAKTWHEHKIRELDGLITKAVAVREGRSPQKMTAADYEALRRSLAAR